MKAIANAMSFSVSNSASRHPQTNGSIERANQFLCGKLAFCLQVHETNDWVSLLPLAEALCNNTVSRVTEQTPHEFTFGKVS
jgi:hypothetical protein